ncbi:hypothetical protein KKF86_06200 [bacterium]|nr:hypothetical protein [bacterium]
MLKLIIVAALAYIGYTFYLKYNALSKINKSSGKKSSKKKYSKMNIQDAEFKDIKDSNKK